MAGPALLRFRHLLLPIGALLMIAAGPAWSQLPDAHEFINLEKQKIQKPPQPGTDGCGIDLKEGDLYLHCLLSKGFPVAKVRGSLMRAISGVGESLPMRRCWLR